jgi:hypothetical protein
MLILLLIWILVLFDLMILGYSFIKLIRHFIHDYSSIVIIKPDEIFFSGFMIVSVLASFASIWMPVGTILLIVISVLSLVLFGIQYIEVKQYCSASIKSHKIVEKPLLIVVAIIVILVLTALVYKITLGDTESYHAQTIQWIRKFAVVPGLGNIHGRLAFNSMFFVVSALFSFHLKDVLIYPLNGICFTILTLKLASLYNSSLKSGIIWKSVFYGLVLLISLLILIPDLNSPSPDIMCAMLVIYTIILLERVLVNVDKSEIISVILLNLVVFSCMTFKISSILLGFSLLLTLNRNFTKRIFITVVIGFLVLLPFIVRNYYLSGYLIYPFPSVDIYNVDWKIPLNEVVSMKQEISGWAKLSTVPYSKVMNMKLYEWIIPWFKELNFHFKMLITLNLISMFLLIRMILKKEIFLIKIQYVIFLNLLLWIVMAPDPRFAYGFLFLGFAIPFSYFVKFLENSKGRNWFRIIPLLLLCFLLLIVGRRIKYPVNMFRNSSSWIIPAPFGSVETKTYNAGFKYRVPIPEGGCFNTEIPCVPYPLTNVVLRGQSIKDGFRISESAK